MKSDKLFTNALDHWRDAKGVGTAFIPAPLNDKYMVLGVLQKMFNKTPDCKAVVLTNNFQERGDIIYFLTHQDDNEENNELFNTLLKNGNIKVFTIDFIAQTRPLYYPLVCIVYRPESICDKLIYYVTRCRFRLFVLNKLFASHEDRNKVYNIAPILDDFKQAEIDNARLSTPIEEERIGIDIPLDSEDWKVLNKYNEYIYISISIFGSFDLLQQANKGNQALNISSMQLCKQIAEENGWSEHLDMSVSFNREIDALYNPMNLKERVSKTYEFIRLRSKFMACYDGKLDIIFKIIQDNSSKKILIINKYADFANKITEYINNMSEHVICMNYHDKLEPIPAIDEYGEPVYYKTGNKKGEKKYIASQAQKTLAENLFNNGVINILCTNSAPDKSLNVDIDIVIITSPLCSEILSYIYRLSNVNFNNKGLKLYSLYCKNTQEQKLLECKTINPNQNVKKFTTDANNMDFIVVD